MLIFQLKRFMSTVAHEQRCKLLIVGAGAGGCSLAAKFGRTLPKGSVILVDPAKVHHYQPMFTLIGAGLKDINQSIKPMESVIPKNVTWIKDSVQHFNPDENQILTSQGNKITYEFMVVAIGIEPNLSKIEGLKEALEAEDSGVCTIYSPTYAEKTFKELKKFKSGNMIFTHPLGPIKCAGAPQKIMHLSDDYLRRNNIRNNAQIFFITGLPKLFSVKKYEEALSKLAYEKEMKTVFEHNIVFVDHKNKEVTFEDLKIKDKKSTYKYSFLHVAPSHQTPQVLRENKMLAGSDGFLLVDKFTLQHDTYNNIFGIGDCTTLPTSKTAAAVAAQLRVLCVNLKQRMLGGKTEAAYNGYSSCPLVTGKGKCILAEFDYDLHPLETFPFNQAQESSLMYFMKSHMMPELYWNLMLNGFWQGPATVRKILRLGLKK